MPSAVFNDFSPDKVSWIIHPMAKPSWIRADDGDWYRASEVVAVKTSPHADGGSLVSVETHRHDNIDLTGRLDDADATRARDELARLLATVGGGRLIRYEGDEFAVTEAD